MFQEKEYSNIRFGLVKLIANDLMIDMIWDSLTDEEIIEKFEKQLMLLSFHTSPVIEDRTNGLHVSIYVDLGNGETGVVKCHVVPTGELSN